MGPVPSPFLAYDIRGMVPAQLNEELAFELGLAYCDVVGARSTVVGRDIRLSSRGLAEALMDGLSEGGSDVLDIGLCGTEQVYFATPYLGADGGIMVTASHNPRDHNGFKLVKRGSVPMHGGNGLFDLRDRLLSGSLKRSSVKGKVLEREITEPYLDKLVSFLGDRTSLSGFKLAADPGNGCAGPVLSMLEERLDLDLVKVRFEPDGSFPSGVPNPILPENRKYVTEAMMRSGADVGMAWDGDFDRCFLFDENGAFTEGYYIVGLLAQRMLEGMPGGKVVHDTRLVWNTRELVLGAGGVPLMNRTGHAFIKDRMRSEDAVYGGEMSAHHYFRDFYYCDTGMVPWLLVLEIMARQGKGLSELLGAMQARYPVSGEINRKVADPAAAIERVEGRFGSGAVSVDLTDGISIEHEMFRINVRASNTEPLIRLNVETRGDRELLGTVTDEGLSLIEMRS
jgi:phosphomannomutase